jgi:WD40 repeat protein
VLVTLRVPAGTRYAAAGPELNRFVVAGHRGATILGRDGLRLARLPHPATVNRAAFSPDRRLIATAGADGDAIVWDAAGRRVRTFAGPADSRAYDVGFSHLSRLVVVASSDGAARVWKIPNGNREAVLSLHGNQVRRARFGDNQDLVLTSSRDGTARTWKVESSAPRAVFSGHVGFVEAAVFVPGDRLATGGEDGTVRTWVSQLQPFLRPATSTPPPEPGRDPRATIVGSVVRLDGDVELVGHRDDVLSVEFASDGRRVVTASADGDARIWNARTGRTLKVLSGHGSTVFDASFSPDGTWVVTAGPATAGLWLSGTGERWYFLRGDGGPIAAAAFASPTRIVTRGDDGIRAYHCDLCGGLDSLVAVAQRRLEGTGRVLSADERRTYLGDR